MTMSIMLLIQTIMNCCIYIYVYMNKKRKRCCNYWYLKNYFTLFHLRVSVCMFSTGYLLVHQCVVVLSNSYGKKQLSSSYWYMDSYNIDRAMIIHLVNLTYIVLQKVWPSIWVLRYRPSIVKEKHIQFTVKN